jgi:hypothetical protein
MGFRLTASNLIFSNSCLVTNTAFWHGIQNQFLSKLNFSSIGNLLLDSTKRLDQGISYLEKVRQESLVLTPIPDGVICSS